jgi:arabinofuranosyltransferase
MRRPVKDLATPVLAAIALIVLATAIAKAWRFTVDDAYITCRYSRNVAEGLGPTFNATGPRAEGYTTFLWMAILVVPHLLGVDAILVAKGLGVAATVATWLVASLWARTEARARGGAATDAGSWAFVGTAVCLAVLPATAIHAVSGMETALFSLLMTAMLAASADRVRGTVRATNRLVTLALLAGLTRPEGNLAAAVAVATTFVLIPREQRRSLAARSLIGWVLPVLAYEVWRHGYYGLPFPLPFYVKLATPGRFPGWPDVRGWLGGPVLHFGVLLLPALARPPRSFWPALVTMAILLAFFVLPQHQMGYDHRYLAPLDPTLAALAGTGLARLAGSTFVRPRVAPAMATALVVAPCALELAGARACIAEEAEYGDGLSRAHERLGRELLQLDIPGGRLAIADSGAVPYLSRWWTLDLVGLNDAGIAISGRHDPDALLAEGLDVVVLASEDADRFQPWDWNPWEEPLLAACENAGFVRVALRRFGPTYWLWVMARPDSPVERGLAALPHREEDGAPRAVARSVPE